MILVTNLFREKSEDFKIYRKGTKIAHFSEAREDELIKKKYALRITKNKEISKPKQTKNKK